MYIFIESFVARVKTATSFHRLRKSKEHLVLKILQSSLSSVTLIGTAALTLLKTFDFNII